MAGRSGVQTFSHNTRLSASAMKRESAPTTRSNSDDSSSSLTGSSPRSSEESSSGGRAKRSDSSFPGELEGHHGKRSEAGVGKGPVLKGRRRFVGVRQRPSGRWVSEIKDTTQKIRLWLGTFDTAEDAARAYDEAAWLLRGANTRTNFVAAPSKADNSALPSKAARLLLLRKNAMLAAATAAAKPGSLENSSKQGPQQQKVQSLSESLTARPSASSELPQRATPMSRHFMPPATPMADLKSFQQQRPETDSATGSKDGAELAAPVMSSSSTPPCSVSSNSSYSRRDMRFDSSASGTHFGAGGSFRSAMDLRSFKVERRQPVVLDHHTRMVTMEESCEVEVNPPNLPELSSSNNSCGRFSLAEEMCSAEVGVLHKSRELPHHNCDDDVREDSRNNSAAGFHIDIQGAAAPQLDDHNISTPMAQQESFDTDMSSGLSGLEDVDLGCVDSDFDFSTEIPMTCGSSDMCGTATSLSNFLHGNALSFPIDTVSDNSTGENSDATAAPSRLSSEDPELSTERMRQMMFGRQLSGGLYAMNGVQECLMLYNSTPAPYCMSSPSLSLPPSFGKPHLPSKNSSNASQGWVHHTNSKGAAAHFGGMGGGNLVSTGLMHSNIYSDSVTAFSSCQQSDYRTTNSVLGEHIHGMSSASQHLTMGTEGPSPEALWNSWDLTPPCPVI